MSKFAGSVIIASLCCAALSCADMTMDPHGAHVRFHFNDQEMDFVFGSLILGSAVNHGAEPGEAFMAAANIKEGDAASWQTEWIKMGALAEARGEKSFAEGHRTSARDQFLRSSYYYRAALVSMLPDDARFKPTADRCRKNMKRAGQLMSPPLEYVEIPFEDTILPGYFRKAGTGTAPTKTLVMIGGAETFAEDQYFYIAPQAFDRGYSFLTVDLPGQGLLPLDGKTFRKDMDVPLKAVIDYALSRPDVDPSKTVIYGISSGGGFAPQAAAHDKRIRALIMNNCVVDAGAGVAKMAVAKANKQVTDSWSSFKLNSNKAIAWRFGINMENLPGLVKANEGFTFDPRQISVPSLILVSNGEYRNPEIRRQTALCMDGIKTARKLVITPEREGASNHCIMENRSLAAQEVFDWLDSVLK